MIVYISQILKNIEHLKLDIFILTLCVDDTFQLLPASFGLF